MAMIWMPILLLALLLGVLGLWRAARRLWLSIPSSNQDFSLE